MKTAYRGEVVGCDGRRRGMVEGGSFFRGMDMSCGHENASGQFGL